MLGENVVKYELNENFKFLCFLSTSLDFAKEKDGGN